MNTGHYVNRLDPGEERIRESITWNTTRKWKKKKVNREERVINKGGTLRSSCVCSEVQKRWENRRAERIHEKIVGKKFSRTDKNYLCTDSRSLENPKQNVLKRNLYLDIVVNLLKCRVKGKNLEDGQTKRQMIFKEQWMTLQLTSW